MAISSPLQSKVPTGSAKTIKKLQTILLNRTKVRREIFQRQTILQNRRIENERRKQREDELEAPNLVTKPRGAAGLIAGSAKGFFERLMGFLSYLTAGWIINNLPTWIAMGKEFIARTQQMGKILGNFIGNTTNIFKDFTKLLGATLTNLMEFDFLDTSGRVSTAFDELNLSIENWGTGFEDAIKLITTPLSEGIASGEDARPLGTVNTNEGAYETSAPYSGSGSGGGQGGKYKPLLDLISSGESPGGGYSAMYPSESHPQILNMSIAEVIQFQKEKRKDGRISAAIGRYQMLYPEKYAAAAGLSLTAKFSPENQDKMVIAYLKKNRRLSEWEQGKISDESFSEELAREFGAFKSASGFVLPRNTGSIGFDKLKPILQKIKSQPSQTPQQSSTSAQQSTPGTGQSVIPFANAKFKGGGGSFGAYRSPTRDHIGIDISESSWKEKSDPRVPVVAIRGGVVSSIEYKGGHTYTSGCMIEQDDGYTLRYLHMEPFVKPGQKVVAGQKIGRLYDNGDKTHLHLELYQGSAKTGKLINPTSYVQTVLRGGTPTPIAPAQTSTPSPAQITPTGTPQNPQIPQSLAPERTGQTVFVSQNPSSPARQMMYSGGGGSSGGGSSQISDFALLNNFIKNKLLLDLAYL
jgi:murein DD-endopeptidase MepM/ murein hydrolase activator NlpD